MNFWKSRNFSIFLSSKVVQGSFNILMIFFSFFLYLITTSLQKSSKIKSSRKINYFSTLKTRWTIWGLPQVEFENQVENPLGISMPPIPFFLLLVCLIFQLPKNLLCWFSSICFTGQAYRNSSKIICGVSRVSQVKKSGVLAVCFKNCAKLGNPLERKTCV